jgi:hypothetical protein
MQFYHLAPGARFEFRNREFLKTAMSVAEDSERLSSIFPGGTEVTPIGEAVLLPEAEAERWKPGKIPWADFITLRPGQTRQT